MPTMLQLPPRFSDLPTPLSFHLKWNFAADIHPLKEFMKDRNLPLNLHFKRYRLFSDPQVLQTLYRMIFFKSDIQVVPSKFYPVLILIFLVFIQNYFLFFKAYREPLKNAQRGRKNYEAELTFSFLYISIKCKLEH